MYYEKAFLINKSDIVAANNVFEAKSWWLSIRPMITDGSVVTAAEVDIDDNGFFVEMKHEYEIMDYVRTLLPGKKLYFERISNGKILMYITLREALKTRDAEEPFVIASIEK